MQVFVELWAVCIVAIAFRAVQDQVAFANMQPALEGSTRTCSTTVIDAAPVEFPRHRGSVTAKPYQFGYACSPSAEPGWPTLKYDLHSGARTTLDHGPGRSSGEPVFVGRQNATAEDDGWLITFVHDVPNERAELAVIDAQEMRVVASVQLPQRVPYGFHGNWVSDRSVPPA